MWKRHFWKPVCTTGKSYEDKGVQLFNNQVLLSRSLRAVVPKLYFIAYHLWVPYCQHVPPCYRKTQSYKYYSIKSFENQNWHNFDMNTISWEITMAIFTPTMEVHKNSGIYEQNTISKIITMNIFFCLEKQKVGLFVYHLESLRVPLVVLAPQFGNHWLRERLTKFPMSIILCTGVRGGGRGGRPLPGLKKFRVNSVFQGKRKLLKKPAWWKNFQCSVYSLGGYPRNLV